MTLTYREITPQDWPLIEALFGDNGACGGCWCMYWRTTIRGKAYASYKGESSRADFRALVESGTALGILALDDAAPIAWCTYGPRVDFDKLNRTRPYAVEDADRVWSLPCFFVRREYRRQGVSRALLTAALVAMKRRGVRIVEAYPTPPPKNGSPLTGAFAFTGPLPIFEALGFEVVKRESFSRPLLRVDLQGVWLCQNRAVILRGVENRTDSPPALS